MTKVDFAPITPQDLERAQIRLQNAGVDLGVASVADKQKYATFLEESRDLLQECKSNFLRQYHETKNPILVDIINRCKNELRILYVAWYLVQSHIDES